MLHVLSFHLRLLALAVRLLPLNSIHIKQSFLNSSLNGFVGCKNWSRSLSQVGLINLLTENTIAACQRFLSVTKKPPALQYPEDNSAVNEVCCKSLPGQIILAIAPSAHFVPLTSFIFVVGETAFFKGIASTSFALVLLIQLLNNCAFGKL